MVPSLIFDIASLDLNHVAYDLAAVEKVNPHRGDMRMLDGIIYLREDATAGLAYKDVRADEFWVPGHIPGRPIFPGVLMIEAAAQLASFCTLVRLKDQGFMGFVGCDDVKFRGQVLPGDRMLILGLETEFRPRRITCKAQILVRGSLVFEGTIVGMPM